VPEKCSNKERIEPMAKLMTPLERIEKAKACVIAARELPAPDSVGWDRLSYVAQVKDKLREAFELVKLIQFSPSASTEVKTAAKTVITEAKAVEEQILKRGRAGDAA
jgi:Tfp pilus assembly ATPase PilU